MTTLAATSSTLAAATPSYNLPGVATVALVLVVVAAGYLLICWAWPFGRCRRCKGLGKRKAPLMRAYRHCPRCDGTGYRLRAGRHVVNYLRRAHRAGTRSDRTR